MHSRSIFGWKPILFFRLWNTYFLQCRSIFDEKPACRFFQIEKWSKITYFDCFWYILWIFLVTWPEIKFWFPLVISDTKNWIHIPAWRVVVIEKCSKKHAKSWIFIQKIQCFLCILEVYLVQNQFYFFYYGTRTFCNAVISLMKNRNKKWRFLLRRLLLATSFTVLIVKVI